MDVPFFLRHRTRVLRQYCEHAASPFNEIIRKIEAVEESYVPPCREDGEPPFISARIDADELREVTGRCCLSTLSASQQLYSRTWERSLGLNCGKAFKAEFKSKQRDCRRLSRLSGLVRGHRLESMPGGP